MNLKIKVEILPTFSIPINRIEWSYDYFFRFYLEGINAVCGSITTFNAQSSAMGLPTSLLSGVTCVGKNSFYYSSFVTGQNSPSTLGLGTNFDAGEYIIFSIQMTVGVADPSWTRDWISAKVFLDTTYIVDISYTCCCDTGGYSYTCHQYDRHYEHHGYGEGYHIGEPLFSGESGNPGVELNAISNLADTET